MFRQLLNEAKIRVVEAAGSSAGTALESDVVDMSGFDGVVFFATIATANAGNFIKVQHGDASNLSDAADLAGTKVVAAANGDIVAVEVFRPVKRYLRAVIVRAGANTVTGEIYAAQYGARVLPVDNNVDDEIVSEIHISPAAGTA